MSVTGSVFSIVRGSLHDGPGVRTVIYFKGCHMRCAWCHNPEGQRMQPDVMLYEQRCIGCGACMALCNQHKLIDGAHIYDPVGCTQCGQCAEICPAEAIELCGRRYDADELTDVIGKDRNFYRFTGGGVSFSGGECLLQSEFLAEALKKCREKGVHTLIESALDVPWENVQRVLPHTDMFYVDVKHMDSDTHKRHTGVSNERIHENLRRLCAAHADVTARIPLIPGVNDDEENILLTCRFAKSIGGGMRGVQLLRYNPLAEDKYRRLHREYADFGREAQSEDYMEALCRRMNEALGEEGFVDFLR